MMHDLLQRKKSLYEALSHRWSIKGKLLALIMFISIISIVSTSLFFMVFEIFTSSEQNKEEAKIISHIMADKLSAAAFFGDPEIVNTELKTFKDLPAVNIAYVTVTDRDKSKGVVKCTDKIKVKDVIGCFIQKDNNIYSFIKNFFIRNETLTEIIYSDGKPVGSLIINYDNKVVLDKIEKILTISFMILMAGVFIAWKITKNTHKIFTEPLMALIEFSKKISLGDYNLRISLEDQAEFSIMAKAFNSMLSAIQLHEEALNKEVKKAHELFEEAKIAKEELEELNMMRSEAEWELQKVQSHLNDVINSMPSVLVGVDKTKRITEWNEAAAEFFGVSIVAALGKNFVKLFPQFQSRLTLLDTAIETREVQTTGRFLYPLNGKERYLDIMIYPLSMDSGGGAVFRIDDDTTRVKMDDMLQHSQKMLSVGGLAAGMAHEINNPLGGIIQSAQNIERRLEVGLAANEEAAKVLGTSVSVVRAYLEERGILKFIKGIRELGERAAAIVHNMLQFSRPTDHKMEEVNLAELIDRTLALAASDYDLKKFFDFKSILIEKEYPSTFPPVPCFAGELEQALLNIFRNAAQAMMDKAHPIVNPKIHIKLSRSTVPQQAVIEIKDNGVGMSEVVKHKCFEPFFTTRETGQGTGLGLAVSYFIISTKHGGELSVESTEGAGATFFIKLPLESGLVEKSSPKS